VRRVGRRVRRAEAVEQRRQVRAIAVTVALCGSLGLLDRQVGRAAGRLQLGKGPGVQLVRQPVAVGIVVEGQLRHGGTPGRSSEGATAGRGIHPRFARAAMLQCSVTGAPHGG
jgi:hypothetical protein